MLQQEPQSRPASVLDKLSVAASVGTTLPWSGVPPAASPPAPRHHRHVDVGGSRLGSAYQELTQEQLVKILQSQITPPSPDARLRAAEDFLRPMSRGNLAKASLGARTGSPARSDIRLQAAVPYKPGRVVTPGWSSLPMPKPSSRPSTALPIGGAFTAPGYPPAAAHSSQTHPHALPLTSMPGTPFSTAAAPGTPQYRSTYRPASSASWHPSMMQQQQMVPPPPRPMLAEHHAMRASTADLFGDHAAGSDYATAAAAAAAPVSAGWPQLPSDSPGNVHTFDTSVPPAVPPTPAAIGTPGADDEQLAAYVSMLTAGDVHSLPAPYAGLTVDSLALMEAAERAFEESNHHPDGGTGTAVADHGALSPSRRSVASIATSTARLLASRSGLPPLGGGEGRRPLDGGAPSPSHMLPHGHGSGASGGGTLSHRHPLDDLRRSYSGTGGKNVPPAPRSGSLDRVLSRIRGLPGSSNGGGSSASGTNYARQRRPNSSAMFMRSLEDLKSPYVPPGAFGGGGSGPPGTPSRPSTAAGLLHAIQQQVQDGQASSVAAGWAGGGGSSIAGSQEWGSQAVRQASAAAGGKQQGAVSVPGASLSLYRGAATSMKHATRQTMDDDQLELEALLAKMRNRDLNKERLEDINLLDMAGDLDAATSCASQAMAMVLNLENPLVSTPEVLEMELEHMSIDDLQRLHRIVRVS